MNNICNKIDLIKVLIISNESNYNKIVDNIHTQKKINNVEFELITVEDVAISRLQHNNYDILILQYGFISNLHSSDLLKMSYAMCKPSIIVHNDVFKYLFDMMFFKLSSFYKKYMFSKFLVKHVYDPSFNNISDVIFSMKQKSNHISMNDIYINIMSLLRYSTVQLKTL